MPESIKRQVPEVPSGSSAQPNTRIDDDRETQSQRNSRRTYPQNYASADDRLFSTPNRSADVDFGREPRLNSPSNQDAFDFNETRRQQHSDSRAVRDVDPERQTQDSPARFNSNDKTARSRSSQRGPLRGTKPLHEDDLLTASRYAAIPINWPEQDRRDIRWPSKSKRRSSNWRPIR